MNTIIIKGNMKVGAGRAIQKWAKLTGNKSLYTEGMAEELLGKGQRSYGHLKETTTDTARVLIRKARKAEADLMISERSGQFTQAIAQKLDIKLVAVVSILIVGSLLMRKS